MRAATDPASDAHAQEPTALKQRYLLVTFIPCYVDAEGEVWLNSNWYVDLREHLTYLKRFVLCAPRLPLCDEPGLVKCDLPAGAEIEYAFLPPQTSFFRALLSFPRTAAAIWKAVGRADIVHSSVIGWPFPLGWIANPMAILRRKQLVVNVESSWRANSPRSGWRSRIIAMDPLRELFARWSCKHASLVLFTQASYRDALCAGRHSASYVTPAVWVNEEDILNRKAAEDVWNEKDREPVRLLFAGRLLASKGVDVLLRALDSLNARGLRVHVDIIGLGGDRRQECVDAAARFNSVRMSVLEPVPYGQAFFSIIRRYHAVLVPSLTDEQPRIVFDANSQGVPIIASDTDGLRPHVDHEQTGWIIPPGDVDALAAAVERATTATVELRRMGMAALEASRGVTHKAMHAHRSLLLRRHCT